MSADKIIQSYQRVNKSTQLEWIFRILFTLEFAHTVLAEQENIYPDFCWLMILLSLWLYFFKAKIVAFIPLIFSFLLHYFHVP